MHADRLLAALGAFFLAVGVRAHALDELNGRPLGTRLSDRTLICLAVAGLAGAVGIGVAGLVIVSVSLAPFIVAGAFIVVAYNLELFGGRFHSDRLVRGGVGRLSRADRLLGERAVAGASGLLVAAACFWLSVAQRRLSTPVRELRRRTASLRGEQVRSDGEIRRLSIATVAAPLDGALRALSIALPLMAVGLVVVRL